MNIYDRAAASVKSHLNESSSIVDSGIIKSAAKSDSLMSESSISFLNQNQAYILQLLREEEKDESSRGETDKNFDEI